jgi:general secretion pathway protein I
MMRSRGFTLLEVLVAMAVASLALLALFGAAAATVRTTDVLRDRTYANLVATNVLAELRARDSWPEPGALSGTARQAERDWRWQAVVSTTEDADVRRLDIVVDDADGERAGALIGFLGRPQVRPPPPGGAP